MREWTWYFRCFNRLVSRYQPRLPRRFPEELFWEIFTGRMPFLSPAQECGRFQTPSPTNSSQLSGTPTILPHSTDNFRRPSTGYLHLINCQCGWFLQKKTDAFSRTLKQHNIVSRCLLSWFRRFPSVLLCRMRTVRRYTSLWPPVTLTHCVETGLHIILCTTSVACQWRYAPGDQQRC